MLERTALDPRSKTLPRVAALLVQVAVLLGLLAQPANAQDAEPTAAEPGVVSVIEVSGLIDNILVDFISTQIDKAQRDDAIALVLQLNSGGAVVSDARLEELVARIRASTVPVDVWVGPSGSQARGGATDLLAAARNVGVAPGSRVEITPALLGPDGLGGDAAVGDTLNARDAVAVGVADNAAPTIGAFLLDLDGFETKVVGEGRDRRREPVTQARFAQLPLTSQLLHTVASPPVAYLLFLIGLALIIFELFTAGIGVAGMVGASCLLLGSYGLAALPTNPVGIGLLLVAMIGFTIDVQTGVPRFWSGVGLVCLTAGSLLLYNGLSLSWLTVAVAVAGVTIAMIGGMPAMIRTRFSTPTIGREWMVGEVGAATSRIAPDGIVLVRGAPWRARTNRATPIALNQEVRVVSIDGLILEVEPHAADLQPHEGRSL
ncbi:MAG: hypothetical protein EXQ71_09300 [Acidimicrobiia bacterium]|nr:hypothetical protein [Acidimicrobiia bacterium]